MRFQIFVARCITFSTVFAASTLYIDLTESKGSSTSPTLGHSHGPSQAPIATVLPASVSQPNPTFTSSLGLSQSVIDTDLAIHADPVIKNIDLSPTSTPDQRLSQSQELNPSPVSSHPKVSSQSSSTETRTHAHHSISASTLTQPVSRSKRLSRSWGSNVPQTLSQSQGSSQSSTTEIPTQTSHSVSASTSDQRLSQLEYSATGIPARSSDAIPCTTAALSPKPRFLNCGTEGTVNNPRTILAFNVTTRGECTSRCLDLKPCISYSHEPTTNICTLYKNRVDTQNFVKGQTGIFYWNHKCYRVHCRCTGTQTACNKDCVDLNTNLNHCGSCGNSCSNGKSCVNGKCDCSGASEALCGNSCINTSSDSSNCGACGTKCASGLVCKNARCDCPLSSQSLCGNTCIDTSTDPSNCGSCGKACPNGTGCSGGKCVCNNSSHTLCKNDCVNIDSDVDNCGKCGIKCGSGQACIKGMCMDSCMGLGRKMCSRKCINTANDNNHCGDCNTKCDTGTFCSGGECVSICKGLSRTYCAGSCVNTKTNSDNCGSCGNACKAGTTCLAGTCTSPCSGRNSTSCGGSCTDTNTDSNNCGSCGNICGLGTACSQGSCTSICGSTNSTLCSGSCVDTNSNGNHCGRCGNQCSSNTACSNGSCTCPQRSPDFNVIPTFTDGACYATPTWVKYYDIVASIFVVGRKPKNTPKGYYLDYTYFNQSLNSSGPCMGSFNRVSDIPAMDIVAFTDPQDKSLRNGVQFSEHIPSSGQPALACYFEIVDGTHYLRCTKDGDKGLFYSCCVDWYWGRFLGDGQEHETICSGLNMRVFSGHLL